MWVEVITRCQLTGEFALRFAQRRTIQFIRLVFLAQRNAGFLIWPGINSSEPGFDGSLFGIGGGHPAVLIVDFKPLFERRTPRDRRSHQEYCCRSPCDRRNFGGGPPVAEASPEREKHRPPEGVADNLTGLLSRPLRLRHRQLIDEGFNFRRASLRKLLEVPVQDRAAMIAASSMLQNLTGPFRRGYLGGHLLNYLLRRTRRVWFGLHTSDAQALELRSLPLEQTLHAGITLRQVSLDILGTAAGTRTCTLL